MSITYTVAYNYMYTILRDTTMYTFYQKNNRQRYKQLVLFPSDAILAFSGLSTHLSTLT